MPQTQPPGRPRPGGLPHASLLRAHGRALLAGRRLPPGRLDGLDVLEKSERTILLRQAATFGPIFKATAYGQFWVILVGLALGRRFLREHGADLQPITLQLDPLVPGGFLRQMRGETHRNYRRALLRALVPADAAAATADLQAIAEDALRRHAGAEADHGGSAAAWLSALGSIATGMLIRIFFGAAPGTPAYVRLMGGYHELGPHGLVWNLGARQRQAFAEIRACLLEHAAPGSASGPGAADCVLGRMRAAGDLDDTLLGNVIYMVEMGRYDTRALFRWLSKYAAEHPDLLERIAGESGSAGERMPLAEAFVLETLRTDQSERLLRRALRDIVFDGHFIPRSAMVRVCLWEPHHSEETFPEPFRFRPERFLDRDFGGDQFAPFGLDQHQCPLGSVAVQTSLVFLRTLARGYAVAALQDGAPVRGAYHWEPASPFSVRLRPRGETR